MRQIVLDTETTGIHIAEGHRIIEIGCIELINRKFTGKRYHQYINPERKIDEGALAVHGITSDFLSDKPYFADVVHDVTEFIQDAELIIHNAPFDLGFLNHELRLAKHSWQSVLDYCRVIDTLILARQMHVGQRNSLDALCKRYSVDNSHREMHGALLDAHLLAQIYLAMTGGQGSLFEDLAPTDAEQKESIAQKIHLPQLDLRIIKADATELAEHAAKLQSIASKGKCVWLGVTESCE
jgi:DNA polymerase-3 subunit epsilon